MAKAKRLQFGVMYHLTGYTKAAWRRDFEVLAAAGFARVVLAESSYNMDAIHAALAECARVGLRGFIIAFSPGFLMKGATKPNPANDKHRCTGIDGQTLKFYNPFLAESRRATLVPPMVKLARGLRGAAGLAGYFIDDTMDADSIISYTPADARIFRVFLREKYHDLAALNRRWGRRYRGWSEIVPPRETMAWRERWRVMWHDWCLARQRWWLDWSDDVVAALRESGPSELVLGDDWYSVRFGYDVAGGYTPAMAAKFDSFSYDYTTAEDYIDPKLANIDRDIAVMRDLVGKRKATIFLKAAARPGKPYRDVKVILKHSERSLRNGVDGIDYYIYRAAEGNYAYKNDLANHPKVFKEVAAFVKSNA